MHTILHTSISLVSTESQHNTCRGRLLHTVSYRCENRERDAVDPDTAFQQFVAFLLQQAAHLSRHTPLLATSRKFSSVRRASWSQATPCGKNFFSCWRAWYANSSTTGVQEDEADLHRRPVLRSLQHMVGRMVNRFLSFTARNTLRDMNLQPKKAATQRDLTRANTAAQTAPKTNFTPHQSKSATTGEESASLAAQQRLQGVGRHASTTEEAAASSQGPGAEAAPADFLEEPPDDLAGADDDEMEGSL